MCDWVSCTHNSRLIFVLTWVRGYQATIAILTKFSPISVDLKLKDVQILRGGLEAVNICATWR